MTDASLEADLAAWGKVIILHTMGRSTGRTRSVSVGFIEEAGPDGPLLVAASDDDTQWARNLLAEPACRVVREGRERAYRAVPLEPAAAQAAVAALILRYGTPAERLGGGPAFRLLPDEDPGTGSARG